MRVLEVLYMISLILAYIGQILSNDKRKMIAPIISLFLAISCIVWEGFRFVMLPAYIIGLFLLGTTFLRLIRKKKTSHKHLIVFKIILGLLSYIIAIGICIIFPVVTIPKPTGNSLIGTRRMDLLEPNRLNLVTGEKEDTRLAVQVWYPAKEIDLEKRATWMDNKNITSLFAKEQGVPDIFGQFSMIKTNSYWDAILSDEEQKYPVVFSGGRGMFNGQNVVQMEELASHGYIVFAVSHPYDDFASISVDGSIIGAKEEWAKQLSVDSKKAIEFAKAHVEDWNSPEFQKVMIQNGILNKESVSIWSKDLQFVADEVQKMTNTKTDFFYQRLDTNKMGILGHSFGGAAAGEACLRDSRFKAFINLDGTPFASSVDSEIEQPFLVMESASNRLYPSDGYKKEQKDFIVVRINDTEHMNFTDLNNVIPILGKKIGVIGSIDAHKQTKIINSYMLAFFDKWLLNHTSNLKMEFEHEYPEVTIIEK